MARELKGRWVCADCGEACVTGEYLTAHSPFDANVILTACPHCRGTETLEAACQAEGCKLVVSSGTPGVDGYRYVRACLNHSPAMGTWTRADPALVDTP